MAIAAVALSFVSCNPATRAASRQADQQYYAEAEQAIKDGSFVLEANTIQFKRGYTVNANNVTNFISVHEGQAVVQLALSNRYPGPNNLGGVTLEGRISKDSITTDRKGNLTYKFDVQGAIISAVVEIVLYNGSSNATATVYPNFNSQRLTVNGRIYPTAQSNIFKGRGI